MIVLLRTFRSLNYRTILLLSTITLIPVFAYADTLTISTDKATYAKSEVMKVTAVYKKNDGTPITKTHHPRSTHQESIRRRDGQDRHDERRQRRLYL